MTHLLEQAKKAWRQNTVRVRTVGERWETGSLEI